MRYKFLALAFVSLALSNEAFSAACTEAQLKSLKENSTGNYYLTCSAKLTSKDVIKKTIIIQGKAGSGVTLDCNGAKIEGPDSADIIKVMSKFINKDKLLMERVENVTIQNCHVKGSVRVIGFGNNGENEIVKKSSLIDDKHTSRARAAAPKNIVFSKMTFEGLARVPLYIGPGSTYVTVKDSQFIGKTNVVAIYLDTESGYNKIIRNIFDTTRTNREMIAVDSSSHNIISGNQFKQAKNGLIYLYRNCGEGGTVRITTPSYNKIIGNWFPTAASDKRIIVNSRSGNRNYCDHDKGKSYGSSVNNNDLGHSNYIGANYFLGKKVGVLVNEGKTNHVFNNITKFSGSFPKRAVCSIGQKIIDEGKSISTYDSNGSNCEKVTLTCKDGTLEKSTTQCTTEKIITTQCAISNKNSACVTIEKCPAGYKAKEARAICNLETADLSQSMINELLFGKMRVHKNSDKVKKGICKIGKTSINSGESDVKVSGTEVTFSCQEHDKNGGDCKIIGQVLCVK